MASEMQWPAAKGSVMRSGQAPSRRGRRRYKTERGSRPLPHEIDRDWTVLSRRVREEKFVTGHGELRENVGNEGDD